MRKTLFILLITLLLPFGFTKGQTNCGADFIFLMDNSGSIDDTTEYPQMRQSTIALMNAVLSCNPNNRVAVVHYATAVDGFTPLISIESDFTNNFAIVQNFTREWTALQGRGDFLHSAIGSIQLALNGTPDASIVSTQTILTRNNPSVNPLVIVVFTDATRGGGGGNSFLVNQFSSGVGTNNAFANFTNLKNQNAFFSVIHVSNNVSAQMAGAAISSITGPYTGAFESYPADPNFGQSNRMYYPQTNFNLAAATVTQITAGVCSIQCTPQTSVDFCLKTMDCAYQNLPFNFGGSYSLPVGATINNFQLGLQDVNTNVIYTSSAVASFPSTGQFLFNITSSNINIPLPFSGQYNFVVMINYSVGSENYAITGMNCYFDEEWFQYDLSFDCCEEVLDIKETVNASNVDSQSASIDIFASNIIHNGAIAIYTAGRSVNLIDGFRAIKGSDFHAYIKDCKKVQIPEKASYYFDYVNASNNPNTPQTYTNRVEETRNDLMFDITPNPASDILNIYVKNEEIKSWQIIDFSGKLVLKGSSNKADVRKLNNGLYMIIIQTDKQSLSKKFIKK